MHQPMSLSIRAVAVLAGLTLAALSSACGGAPGPVQGPASEPVPLSTGAPPDAPPAADRPEMTSAECEAKGGKVVGDIGDGAIHRPDYTCQSGAKPIGHIALGVEGSVCCP